VLRPGHELFQKPFPVEVKLEQTEAPDNFEKWKPGFGKTVATFPIFAAYDEKKDEPGLVTSDAGFEEIPDAERILGGINMKGPDYAAVARHGSFVMWGFHCKPEAFSDAGRRLFLNALAYAVAHKGQLVETLRLRPSRVDLEHMLTIFMPLYPEAQRKDTLGRHYAGEEFPAALFSDAAAGKKWFDERAPFLHPAADGSDWNTAYQLAIDPECKQLGLPNDSLAFLDALAARLAKDKADALATSLAARYLPDVPAAELGAWLAKNRERLYFTEAGGWVWRVKGARAKSAALRDASGETDPAVSLRAEATDTQLKVTLRIAKGWHAYAPGAKDAKAAMPVAIAIADGSVFEAAGEPDFGEQEDGLLIGYVEIKLPLKRIAPGDALLVDVTYTVCDEKACKPPRTVRLTR
jgi:hypothetical protein